MVDALPDGRWVLHTAPRLGGITDRWIDLQAQMSERFESRLLGGDLEEGASRQPHWLIAREHAGMELAYRLMYRTGGASLALAARPFRARPPAVVHSHYGELAALHRPFARPLGSPLIASFYGYDATKSIYRTDARWRRRYAKLFEHAAGVIVEGPAMASRVEALGCPSGLIHVVRMPADEEALATVRGEKADHFRVVAAGRFVEKKGFDTAIRAFARALRDKPDARLALLGGGPLEQELRAVAAEERIEGQVEWGGRMPFPAFMGEIARSHVGLHPSRVAASGDSEGGAPVTLIESQWLGVPAIVSDHDDLPFVVAPRGSFVLPPLDIDRWAECLESLYDDPSRLGEMGEAASLFARENHAAASNLAARETIYAEVS